MDYEAFVSEYLKRLKERLGDVQIERKQMQKVNETVDSFLVRYPDSNIAPSLPLGVRYRQFQDGCPMDKVVGETEMLLHQIREEELILPKLNRETAKESLYAVIVNAKKNEELLRTVPHERIADLAMIPRFRVSDNASFIVNEGICRELKMTASEVMEQAKKNTKQQEYQCISIAEVLREIMTKQNVPEEYMREVLTGVEHDCPMYVLSNKRRVEGAVVLGNRMALDQARAYLGEDIYILPSSRHEVIVVPVSAFADDVRLLRDMVAEVNRAEVDERDRLSDNVYFYGESRQLRMAEERERAEQVKEQKSVAKSVRR